MRGISPQVVGLDAFIVVVRIQGRTGQHRDIVAPLQLAGEECGARGNIRRQLPVDFVAVELVDEMRERRAVRRGGEEGLRQHVAVFAGDQERINSQRLEAAMDHEVRVGIEPAVLQHDFEPDQIGQLRARVGLAPVFGEPKGRGIDGILPDLDLPTGVQLPRILDVGELFLRRCFRNREVDNPRDGRLGLCRGSRFIEKRGQGLRTHCGAGLGGLNNRVVGFSFRCDDGQGIEAESGSSTLPLFPLKWLGR